MSILRKAPVVLLTAAALGLFLFEPVGAQERRMTLQQAIALITEEGEWEQGMAALEQLLDAGRYAPTGSNSENVHYVVVIDPDELAELHRRTVAFYEKLFARLANPVSRLVVSMVAGRTQTRRLNEEYRPLLELAQERMARGDDRLLYHAPAVIVAHAEKTDGCSAFNCAIALYNCSLMGHALGVGCCFNGFVEGAVGHDRGLHRWLGIPDDHQCYGAMGLGWQKLRYRTLIERQAPKVTWR